MEAEDSGCRLIHHAAKLLMLSENMQIGLVQATYAPYLYTITNRDLVFSAYILFEYYRIDLGSL